jgi:hypothetical protein
MHKRKVNQEVPSATMPEQDIDSRETGEQTSYVIKDVPVAPPYPVKRRVVVGGAQRSQQVRRALARAHRSSVGRHH